MPALRVQIPKVPLTEEEQAQLRRRSSLFGGLGPRGSGPRVSERGRKNWALLRVAHLRSEVNTELNFPPNFEGLVLGCIDADFCK